MLMTPAFRVTHSKASALRSDPGGVAPARRRVPRLAAVAIACLAAWWAQAGRAAADPAPAWQPGSMAKLAPSLARLVMARPDERVVAWVYFTDRAGAERDLASLAARQPLVSARSLERRLRRGLVTGLLESDLPVHEAYVRALTARGATLRGTSRWLDAASVEMTGRLAVELSHLPFVSRVELVPVAQRMRPVAEPAEIVSGGGQSAPAALGRAASGAATLAPGDTAYYGGSFKQLAMMQVPQLHKLGLSGAGVIVCMLDAGFRVTHEVFANLHVLAARDFIHGDTIVDDQPGQDSTGQASHGTMTLACVAGSKPGTYSGAAFGATVALAKTEWVPTETPIEMDYWQFGAEWADSLGADVISSSLGYSRFDTGYPSYTLADMDGRTTVVARAAIEAARRGITVVNAAGNEGTDSTWMKIISPADADSIVAVGAVDSFNVVTAFSSRGPTADGRIKPEVTAMGSRVLVPRFGTDPTAYARASGTSFSTPLTAGVVALLLQAHPGWGPFEVREALRHTALNHATPDTVIGWGLVQGLAANAWSTIGVPSEPWTPGVSLAAGPNPLRAGTELSVRFAAPGAARVTIDVLDLAGRREARLYDGPARGPSGARWNGRDRRGAPARPGVYFVRLACAGSRGAPSRAVRVALVP